MGNSLSPRRGRGGGYRGHRGYSRVSTNDNEEDPEFDDYAFDSGDFYRRAALSRAVSTRVLSQTVRRPHGLPRQVASLVALDRGGLGLAAGSYLYLNRWAASVGLFGMSGGGGMGRRRRHHSLPSLSSILRDHGIVYEYLAEALRGELDTICLRALEKKPADRYPSVDAMLQATQTYIEAQIDL